MISVNPSNLVLFLPLRWMPPRGHPQAPCVHRLWPVESESFNRRSTGGGQTQNRCSVRTPDKMLRPALVPRMIERNSPIAFGIDACCVGIFVPVAARTGQTQILQSIRTTCSTGNDMIDGEDQPSETFRTFAVFATPVCTFTHCLSDRIRNAGGHQLTACGCSKNELTSWPRCFRRASDWARRKTDRSYPDKSVIRSASSRGVR